MDKHSTNTPRDFFYIDDRLLKMYFTQLDRKYLRQFNDRDTKTIIKKIEISFTPKVVAEEAPKSLPLDACIILAEFMEKYFKGGFDVEVGSPETLRGQFIEGVFDCNYTTIKNKRAEPIFVAFPKSSIYGELEKNKKAFYILGDAGKCWNTRETYTQTNPDGSAIQRLFDVWEDIKISMSDHVQGHERPESGYQWFSGGRTNVFSSLCLMEMKLQPNFLSSSFKGLLRVRDRFHNDKGDEICVLYPLYLERFSN